jgi:hypothetical protein
MRLVVGFTLVAFTQIAPAGVVFQSTFDSGTEGWTAFRSDATNTVLPVSWSAGIGNPAGSLQHDAPSDNFTSFFLAPAALATALHSAVGGRIHWELSTQKSANDVFFSNAADIQIRGTAGPSGLRLRLPALPVTAPLLPDFDAFEVDFTTASNWQLFDGTNTTVATQAQIDSVLSGALNMIIRAEYWSGSSPDSTFLDNVVVSTVPEPVSLLLSLLALVALAITRSRASSAAATIGVRREH